MYICLHELEPSFTFVLLCMLSVDDLTHFQLLVCDIRYPLLTKNLNNTGDLRDFSLNSLWCFQQKHQFEFASKKYANSRLSAFYFRNWDKITLTIKSVYYMYRRTCLYKTLRVFICKMRRYHLISNRYSCAM